MGPLRAGAEGASLGAIKHRAAEVGISDAGIGETALEQHRVAQQRSPQIGPLQPAGKDNRVLQIHGPQIGALQIAAVEHGPPQVCLVQIHPGEVRFEKFLLAEIPPMHVGLNLLQGPLSPQFRRGDRQRLSGAAEDHAPHH